MDNTNVKPPPGIKPAFMIEMDRAGEIILAMGRYFEVDAKIPVEWAEELLERIKKSY